MGSTRNMIKTQNGFFKSPTSTTPKVDLKNWFPAGPQSYNTNFEIVGNQKIAKAQIKNQPMFSFNRAKTFRTVNSSVVTSRSNSRDQKISRNDTRATNGNFVSLDNVAHAKVMGKYSRGTPTSDTLMPFFKTDEF